MKVMYLSVVLMLVSCASNSPDPQVTRDITREDFCSQVRSGRPFTLEELNALEHEVDLKLQELLWEEKRLQAEIDEVSSLVGSCDVGIIGMNCRNGVGGRVANTKRKLKEQKSALEETRMIKASVICLKQAVQVVSQH